MIGWTDKNGNPQGGFPDKIVSVREQLKNILRDHGTEPRTVVENPQPYLEPNGKIPKPEVKDYE